MQQQEESKQMDDPDAIARRLRDKIRLQAEQLLRQCDEQQDLGSGSRRSSRAVSPSTTTTAVVVNGSSEHAPALDETENSESSDLLASPSKGNSLLLQQTTSSLLASTTSPAVASSSGAATPTQAPSSSNNNELTKRLQQLAVSRRQTLADNNSLRVIQADPTQQHLSSQTVESFAELPLPPNLLKAVYAMGWDRPSQIQEAALPRILLPQDQEQRRNNLIAQAPSGSGKTAAFALGMLFHCKVDDKEIRTQALCVAPTRELAIQIVEQAVRPLAAVGLPAGFRVGLAIAGSSDWEPAHLWVGTPGKLVDGCKRGRIRTDDCKVFVLDEADHMVTAGGGHRANALLLKKRMPPTCQSLFFSATFPPEVLKFAAKIAGGADQILLGTGGGDGSDGNGVDNNAAALVLDVIKQIWIDTSQYRGSKLEFLADIYSLLTVGQSIVFVETKQEADTIHQTLSNSGYTCSVLHGGLEAAQRDQTMDDFRRGRSNVLITTNVLARGVDVDNVCLVVNYSPPVTGMGSERTPDYETYLHRIGRTGRFGRKGSAITLVQNAEEIACLAAIERYFTGDSGKEMLQQAAADPEALADVVEI